jgi:preprotein translocase subunit SecB
MTNGNGTPQEAPAPQLNVLAQYTKDLSFENPNAPAIYQSQTPPQIDVQFNIGGNQVGEDVHEIMLKIEVKAEINGQVAFLVDLSYAGLFGLRNVPADQAHPFLFGEAPRLLFPFARRVLADAIRDGNFPPLVLDPIDFNALYLSQIQAAADAQGEAAGNA